MAEQLRMGVLRNKKPETFVVVSLDTESSQFIKRVAFHSEKEFRAIFKKLSEPEMEALLAQVRAHLVD